MSPWWEDSENLNLSRVTHKEVLQPSWSMPLTNQPLPTPCPLHMPVSAWNGPHYEQASAFSRILSLSSVFASESHHAYICLFIFNFAEFLSKTYRPQGQDVVCLVQDCGSATWTMIIAQDFTKGGGAVIWTLTLDVNCSNSFVEDTISIPYSSFV